jgi:fatty-acyl-CoA synthase
MSASGNAHSSPDPDRDTSSSWADGGTSADPPGWTVGDVLRNAAVSAPDAEAFVVRDGAERRVWTFASLAGDASSVARWLTADGRAGAPVALWAPNCADVVLAQMAIALAGSVLVPLNPNLRPDEVAHVLRASGAELVLVAGDYRGEALPRIVTEVAPAVEQIVLDGSGRVLLDLGREAPSGIELADPDPDDLAQLQFTSGTTGPAKAVRITHRAMALTGRVFADRLGLRSDSTFLNPMPLFHTAGNVLGVMSTLTTGARHVVLQFSPDATLDAIAAEHPTVVSLAPTLLHMVQSHPRFADTDVASVETVFTGGMTMAPSAMEEVERRFGAPLVITFGMTETCGTALMTAPDDTPDTRHTTVGRPVPHTEVRIVDPDGHTVPVGGLGELCVRGPRVTAGYLGDPEATAATIDPDGWLHTGDEATMDAHGRFRITGRLKDMIKTGGENLSPSEVEDVLVAHPSVDMAAVIGVPDERWGEIVMAFVVAASDATVDTGELDSFCRERLASFKIPRRWAVVDDLPRTASGKVQRAVLRQRQE